MFGTALMKFQDKILDELYENAHKYKDYHTGSVRKLIEDSIKYLKEMKYTLDIVDVVVGACANALKVNLYIFQRENDNCSLIPTYRLTVASLQIVTSS